MNGSEGYTPIPDGQEFQTPEGTANENTFTKEKREMPNYLGASPENKFGEKPDLGLSKVRKELTAENPVLDNEGQYGFNQKLYFPGREVEESQAEMERPSISAIKESLNKADDPTITARNNNGQIYTFKLSDIIRVYSNDGTDLLNRTTE